jgi:hypothetical protein
MVLVRLVTRIFDHVICCIIGAPIHLKLRVRVRIRVGVRARARLGLGFRIMVI